MQVGNITLVKYGSNMFDILLIWIKIWWYMCVKRIITHYISLFPGSSILLVVVARRCLGRVIIDPREPGKSDLSITPVLIPAACCWCSTYYLIVYRSRLISLGYEVGWRMLINDCVIYRHLFIARLSRDSGDQRDVLISELITIYS